MVKLWGLLDSFSFPDSAWQWQCKVRHLIRGGVAWFAVPCNSWVFMPLDFISPLHVVSGNAWHTNVYRMHDTMYMVCVAMITQQCFEKQIFKTIPTLLISIGAAPIPRIHLQSHESLSAPKWLLAEVKRVNEKELAEGQGLHPPEVHSTGQSLGPPSLLPARFSARMFQN